MRVALQIAPRTGLTVFVLRGERTIPNRGRSTFNKRQKEQQRKERNMEKLARRQQRKQEKQIIGANGDPVESDDMAPSVPDAQSPSE